MPKSNVVDVDDLFEEELEEEKREKSKKKSVAKARAELMAEDDDVFDLVLAKDPKLAALYLLAEKASERAIMRFLMLMGNSKGEDEVDKMLKMYLLRKMQEEEEEKKKLKEMFLPQLISAITKSYTERSKEECIRNALLQALLSGQAITPSTYSQIVQMCTQQAQAQQSAVANLLPMIMGEETKAETESSEAEEIPEDEDLGL